MRDEETDTKISFHKVGENFKGLETTNPIEDQQKQIRRVLQEHMNMWGWSDICAEGRNDQLNGLGTSRGENSESGIVSTREITSLISAMKEVNEEITFADLFRKVRYGHRIMHLAPTTDNNFSAVEADFAHAWNPEQMVMTSDHLHDDNRGSYNFSFLARNISDKFFVLERSYETFEVMLDAQIREEKRISTTGEISYDTETSHIVRPIFTTPLVERELNVNFGGKSMMDRPASDWNEVSNIKLNDWDKFIVDTDEYQLLFDYVFPIERYFSLMSIYSIQGVSSMRGVETAFDTTIEEFIKLFKICHNAGDYAYVDDNIACVGFNPGIKQAVGNVPKIGGVLADCLPDLGFGFCMQGIGFAFPIKFAFKTPLLILKAIIEIIDPLISLGKLLQISLSLSGVCLPIPAVSMALLPVNIFMPPPIGIGIGPPLTPLGILYMALGFGMIDLSLTADASDLAKLANHLPIDLNLGSSDYVCETEEKLNNPRNKNNKKVGFHNEPIHPSATQMTMATLVEKLDRDEDEPKMSLNDFFEGTRNT